MRSLRLGRLYWTPHGHPPPVGMYRAPWEWRLAIMLAPYAVVMVVRLVFGRAILRRLDAPLGTDRPAPT